MWGLGNKRNRRRLGIAAAACALAIGGMVGPGGGIVGQMLAGESLTDLLAGRSPGERGTAGLIKVKDLPLGLRNVTPRQRVLPLLRPRAPIVPGEEPLLPGGPLASGLPDFDVPGVGLVTPPVGGDILGGGPPIDGLGGFPIIPPGNPGLFPPDTSTPTPTPTPEPTPTPTPPVPEPAAWLMLIFGFGTIGGALRRARATGRAGREGVGAGA